jgi:predicted ATP-grasp superfamily ATP-dependent carboligase
MRILDTTTPLLVLNCKLGGLAIMRSLGALGVRIWGVDADAGAPALGSRYCRKRFVVPFQEDQPHSYLKRILEIGRHLGRKAILIPTSDELSVFVAEHADALGEQFLFPRNDPALVQALMSKEGMYALANQHGVPTAATLFPRSVDDVRRYADQVQFPVMLKGIFGNRLQQRTGKKMLIVHGKDDLIDNYRKLEDPALPNLMVQEYIPGNDDQIYIFNGYFDGSSDCRVGFTGHKVRQYPVHVGCASLGICTWNQTVHDLTTTFMKTLGYRGILDIGYRWDPRDQKYKVLDINPRVGQAFRLFVAKNDMDVVRALYLDLTGQVLDASPPRVGRKWLIEDYDLQSSLHYYQERTLTLGQWVRSFRGVEEAAWFSWQDPAPFLRMSAAMSRKALQWSGKRLGWARPSRNGHA